MRILGIISCSTKEFEDVSKLKSQIPAENNLLKKVKLASGGEILEFENFSIFEKTVEEFGKISTEEKQKFKKNDFGINFRSLSS